MSITEPGVSAPNVDGPRPQDTCQQCGTTAYTRADMVGDVCPACAGENALVADAAQAAADAVAAQRVLVAHREERQASVDEKNRQAAESDRIVDNAKADARAALDAHVPADRMAAGKPAHRSPKPA